MKKSLVALLLLISSKQILACDYYEDKSVISKTLDTGIYHKNISGVVCSPNKTITIPIKNGKVKGLYKEYYESGVAKEKGNLKNNKREGLWKYYDESGKLKEKVNYRNGERID